TPGGVRGSDRRSRSGPQGAARASADRPGATGRRARRPAADQRCRVPTAVPSGSPGVTTPVVLAVDGGNFKTDLALVRADGSALALVRGPQSSPHHLGVDGCVRVLEELLATAVRVADLPIWRWPVADWDQLLLSGVAFPSDGS